MIIRLSQKLNTKIKVGALSDIPLQVMQNNKTRDKELQSAIRYAKSLDRSVIGSMNDLVFGAKLMIDGGVDLQETADRLNETPLKALTNPDARRYAKPYEVFRRIIEEVRQ